VAFLEVELPRLQIGLAVALMAAIGRVVIVQSCHYLPKFGVPADRPLPSAAGPTAVEKLIVSRDA
jgi:hypothetical protein